MASRLEVSEQWQYLPNRSVSRGDMLRISGGPVYKSPSTGELHRMGHRGVFKFVEHCLNGCDEYIVVASSLGGTFVIPLRMRRSKLGIKGYRNLPYRFRKVRKK